MTRFDVVFNARLQLQYRMPHYILLVKYQISQLLIFFFFQGATIKPLVDLLKIRRQTTKTSSLFTEVNKKVIIVVAFLIINYLKADLKKNN